MTDFKLGQSNEKQLEESVKETGTSNEKLAIAIKNGDKSLVTQLWLNIEKLVALQARKYFGRNEARCTSFGVTVEDLTQEGFFAIQKAIDAYEAESEYKFTTYLHYHLLTQFEELAHKRTSKQKKHITCMQSLDAGFTLNDDSAEQTLADSLVDENASQSFTHIEDEDYIKSLHDSLEICLSSLPAQDGELVRDMYYRNKQLAQIASMHKLPETTVRSRMDSSYRRLRTGKNLVRLKTYRDDIISRYTYHGGFTDWKHRGSSSTEFIIEKLESKALA